MHRLISTFTRRKVNIESLTVSATEREGISRFTLVVKTTSSLIKTITKQIDRIIEVQEAFFSENSQLVFQEVAFFRVGPIEMKLRPEIEELAHRYGAKVVYANGNSLVFEHAGSEDDIDALYRLFESYGVQEFVRSGRIALRKEFGDREIFGSSK
jgi:acetolactate synthase-1/3 small subunit